MNCHRNVFSGTESNIYQTEGGLPTALTIYQHW